MTADAHVVATSEREALVEARRAYDRAEREAVYAGYRLFGYLDGARPWLVELAAQAEARGEGVAQFRGLLRLLDEWRDLIQAREAAADAESAASAAVERPTTMGAEVAR